MNSWIEMNRLNFVEGMLEGRMHYNAYGMLCIVTTRWVKLSLNDLLDWYIDLQSQTCHDEDVTHSMS